MNEEVLKVLEMIKEGKITPEEGEKLLAAMRANDKGDSPKSHVKNSMLRVRADVADSEEKGQVKVNVNIPLTLAKKAAGLISLIPKDAKSELADKGIDLEAIDIAELIGLFEDGLLTEELVNIDVGDSENGARVRVYVD
jgi:Asp-tRNA(Asn)/Glu-tRNA(Gln) amidotransferase B subunit